MKNANHEAQKLFFTLSLETFNYMRKLQSALGKEMEASEMELLHIKMLNELIRENPYETIVESIFDEIEQCIESQKTIPKKFKSGGIKSEK